MSEQDTKILQDMFGYIFDMKKSNDATRDLVVKLDANVSGRMDALDARLDRLETRLAASDRFADQQAEKQSDGFARVHSKFDESEERAKARSARIEARLDAIDGRLTTLTATVALHDLQLREAK